MLTHRQPSQSLLDHFSQNAQRLLSRFALLGAIALSALVTSSCRYARDRLADLQDVGTFAITKGIGVHAQAGFVSTSLGAQGGVLGLEDGRGYAEWGEGAVFGGGTTDLGILVLSAKANPNLKARGKDYQGITVLGILPVIGDKTRTHLSAEYLTKLEVGACFGIGARVGLNPGELVDFLLGFFLVDLYGDDQRTRDREPQRVPAAQPAPPATLEERLPRLVATFPGGRLSVAAAVEALDRETDLVLEIGDLEPIWPLVIELPDLSGATVDAVLDALVEAVHRQHGATLRWTRGDGDRVRLHR